MSRNRLDVMTTSMFITKLKVFMLMTTKNSLVVMVINPVVIF